ncbi:MAG: ABC transporter substrate-binding protein [Lentisphaerota bacterium]
MSLKIYAIMAIMCLFVGLRDQGYCQMTNVPLNAVTVTDAVGRVVAFSSPPQRMVVAGKASFMIADAVGLFPEERQNMVTYSGGKSSRQGAGDFLSLVMPGPASMDLLGGEAGAEQIAAAKPDVVLMKSSSSRLGDVLSRLGLPVVYLDFETTAHYARDVAVLGQLLGNGDRAQFLISYYQDLLSGVRSRIAAGSEARKSRTLLLQYSERGGVVAFSVPGPDWMQTALVELAGGIPVWKEAAQRGGWTVVNLEQIAVWDPDIVFVVDYIASANQAVAEIMADTKWQALRAAKENKIYAFPGDYYSWDQPDPRWGLGLLWLATRIHPQLFDQTDLRREIVRFYQLYDLDVEAIESRVLPLIRENMAHVPK